MKHTGTAVSPSTVTFLLTDRKIVDSKERSRYRPQISRQVHRPLISQQVPTVNRKLVSNYCTLVGRYRLFKGLPIVLPTCVIRLYEFFCGGSLGEESAKEKSTTAVKPETCLPKTMAF